MNGAPKPKYELYQIYDSDAEIVLDRIFVDGIAVGRVCSELAFRGGRGDRKSVV